MDSSVYRKRSNLIYIVVLSMTIGLSGCLGGGGSSRDTISPQPEDPTPPTTEQKPREQEPATETPEEEPEEEENEPPPEESEPPVEEEPEQDPPESQNDSSILLTWDAPLERHSGELLEEFDLYGYIVYYSSTDGDEQGIIIVGDPDINQIDLTDLPEDTYNFVITSIDIYGLESASSSAVSKQIINDGLEATPVPIAEQTTQPDLAVLIEEITSNTFISQEFIDEILASSEQLDFYIGYIGSSD